MYSIRFGSWNTHATNKFIFTRVRFQGHWTPVCHVRRRHTNLLERVIALRAKYAELQDFALWMTGCSYDFPQHDYFIRARHLLADDPEMERLPNPPQVKKT